MSCTWVSRILLAAVVVVLSACQVTVDINIDVTADGSGTVAVQTLFDDAANDRIGDVASQARIKDLRGAGWDVLTDEPGDGSVTIIATKAVATAGQWQGVLDEIAGPGVFTNVQIATDDKFANSSQRITLDLDLADGWDLLSDEGVAEALNGEPFGAPIDTLTNGRSIDEIIALELTASISSDDESTLSVASFLPRFDADEVLHVSIGSTNEKSMAVLFRWISLALLSLFVLAIVLAVIGIVLQRRSDRLRPAPTPARLASRVPGGSVFIAAMAPKKPTPRVGDAVRLVVIEPLSVLYEQTRPVDDFLLPFVREHGSATGADTVAEGYRRLIVGEIQTQAFWQLCGLERDAKELDEAFASRRELGPGVAKFLQEMQSRRVMVAAATNDAGSWSTLVRERDRLSAVQPWLVSSIQRTSNHDGAIFEILRRESGVAHSHCLFVDTDLRSLDAAKDLGLQTALFDHGDLVLPEIVGHRVVTGLRELFG